MNWSDTPPTVAGDYWVRRIPSGEEQIGTLDGENWYFKWPYEDWFPADNPEQFQFGHRIPTNAELGELLGLIEEYANCMTISQEMYDNCDDEKAMSTATGAPQRDPRSTQFWGCEMTPEKVERVMGMVELFGVETWKAGMWHTSEKLVEEHGASADKILAEIRAALTAESEGDE